MRRIMLSSVACLALPHFSTLSHNRHDFREKVIDHKVRVLIFSTILSENFLDLRRNERGVIKMYSGFHVQYSLFLSDVNENLILSTDFRKILKSQISSNSVQWEPSSSMRTDRQKESLTDGQTERRTDMTRLIVVFRNFVNAPKNNTI